MGELLSIFWPSHAQQLCEGMWKCLQECFKTDFVISVNKNDGVQRLVKAHYLMLSIFCPSIKNAEERILEFDYRSNVEEEDLRFLLEFIYRGKTKIPVKRMGNLKAAAQLLGLKVLVDSIEKCERCRKAAAEDEDTVAAAAATSTASEDDDDEEATIDDDDEEADAAEEEEDAADEEEKVEQRPESKMMTRNSVKNSTELHKRQQLSNDAGSTRSQLSILKRKRGRVETSSSSSLAKPSETELESTTSFDFTSQTCHLCDKKFNNRNAFRRHVRCHLEPSIMQQCPHCPAKFPNSKQVVSHVALKHQMDMEGNVLEKKFKCDECDFTSVYQSSIKNHKAYKHGLKTQKCDQCSYSCHNYADLLQHKDGVHSELRPFMCDHCGFRAKTKSSIRLHLTMHQEKIPCDICGALYKYRALNRHKRNIHCANKKGFACHICPYATSCKSYLQTHMTKVHKVPTAGEAASSRAKNSSQTITQSSG